MDGRKFNRGKLLNIGFHLAEQEGRRHEVFVFHDVDLIPSQELVPHYTQRPPRPMHIARVWGRWVAFMDSWRNFKIYGELSREGGPALGSAGVRHARQK